jgi:hypothetical protein
MSLFDGRGRTLSVSTVMPRLVRWISGTLVGSISFKNACSVYMR